MQINFINPVLSACTDVLISMADLELKVGKPYKRNPDTPVVGKRITGLISMRGKVRRASIAIVFSDDVLAYIAEKMLPKGSMEMDSVAIDLVGEISNMILGRAKGELEKVGYDFEIALPTMMIGYDYLIPHQTSSPILRIPYESSGGAFYVEVCFDGPPISAEEAKAAESRKAEPSTQTKSDVELF